MLHNTMTFYHSIHVNKVEITDSATFWLGPSKEDSSVVVNTVSVKNAQGGGLVPLMGGENQTPAGECTSINI